MKIRFLKNVLIIFGSQILNFSICSINSLNANPGQTWIDVALTRFPRMHKLKTTSHISAAVYLTDDIQKRHASLKGKNPTFLEDIFEHLQKLMQPYGFQITFVHFEDWGHNRRAPYLTASDMSPLVNYIQDKDENIDFHIFLAPVRWGGRIGVAYMDALCSPRPIAVVDLLSSYHKDTEFAATVLAHELGHVLGFKHHVPRLSCDCDGECIMSAAITNRGQNGTIYTFSDCEISKLDLSSDSKTCIHEPDEGIKYFLKCGNGIVDEGEQCECFIFESTYGLSNTECCNCTSCQLLKDEYQCSDGPCCHACMFTVGNICRIPFSDCDIADRCTGYSADCPIDVVHPNNQLCDDGKGFCKDGMCLNLDDICRITYKDPQAFFTIHCLDKVEEILDLYCQYSLSYRDHVCEQEMDTCRWLVCSSWGIYLRNSNQINYGYYPKCFITSPDIENSMPNAPNYMPCSSSDRKKRCYFGKCVHEDQIPECANSGCNNLTKNKFSRTNKHILYGVFRDENILQDPFHHMQSLRQGFENDGQPSVQSIDHEFNKGIIFSIFRSKLVRMLTNFILTILVNSGIAYLLYLWQQNKKRHETFVYAVN